MYSERLNKVIPGGAHTYSRGDDQYPSNAPQILSYAKDAFVWDPDGNRYLDYGMALRAITVGYNYEPISEAAIAEIRKGNNLTRPSLTELNAAELITNLIPHAEMVKFSKNGSTATSAAFKLARAYTGKKYIAVCADHPFFSYDDWFIGSTVVERGIPHEYKSLTLRFHYNNIQSLEELFEQHPNEIAAVILEPTTTVGPKENFLHKIRELCTKNGTVFILDEMITGFRMHLQGAATYFGVVPDMTTFGKGMANGFSVAALCGKKEIMKLGGIKEEGAERVFLISTTHGAEMCGLGAFIKTIEVYKTLDVVGQIWKNGEQLRKGMNGIAQELGIAEYFYVEGDYPCLLNYITKNKKGEVDLAFRTLFAQEMIKHKVLIPWISVAYMHKEKELGITLDATREALKIYALALENGVEKYLKGKAIKPVFRKYN